MEVNTVPRVKIHIDLYVIQFYVVIVFHLVKQSAKPLALFFSMLSTCSVVTKFRLSTHASGLKSHK